MEIEEKKADYKPTKKEVENIAKVYAEFSDMRDIQTKPYKYFNDRTLKQFIDDSEKRFNSYVPSRTSQGKEKWQSNFFHPTTRNKTMAILAAVALDVPKIRIVARDEKNNINAKIGRTVAELVKGSYDNENKEENLFFEGLEGVVKGTVITAEAYLKTKVKQKIIKSFDVVTGEIEFEEKDVIIDKGCNDFIVPLENFFIANAFIRDLQKQPAVCWVQYMEKDDFEYEFNRYKNFQFVKESGQLLGEEIQKRFFFEAWSTRTDKKPYEIVRYYNKTKDEHIVIANGVQMFYGPMLLGGKEKYYPFSKSGYAPFSSDFFWMNSLPNTMMGEQDIINSFYNMASDKTYKSLVTNLLIGMTNKDDFDLEDDNVTLDTKIYVQDINQVREMPNSGITQSEIKMIDIIGKGLDLSSVDASQQGVAPGNRTAREVVIANDNARKLKGIFFMFITSLWMQKTKLRMLNILAYYTVKDVDSTIGKEKGKQFRKFIVNNVELSDGVNGTKGIIIAQTKEDLPTPDEINTSAKEHEKINENEPYEEIAVVKDYILQWEYELKVISESLYQNDSAYSISKNEDKLKTIATLFPQQFQLNTKKLFEDTLMAYDEDVDEYDLEEKKPEVAAGAEGAGIPTGDGSVPPATPGAQPGGPEGALPPIDMSKLPPTMR